MKNTVTIILYAASIFLSISSFAQYSLSSERIVPKSQELIKRQTQRSHYPVGQNGKALVYQINHKGESTSGLSSEAVLKIYYDEITGQILDSIDLRKRYRKTHRIKQQDNITLFHGFYTVPEAFENKLIDDLDRGEFLLDYQDIWLENNGKSFRVKSYPEHYYDRDVEYSIDSSGKYALVSTFVSEYLRSTKADSTISIFDLTSEKIREIYCVECIRPQIVGNYIYYGKKFFYLLGADVYDWKIYRAPIFDLSKSELLGEYIEIILVSTDSKHILGKKLLHGKETLVILDAKTKKFQYILGRDYTTYKFFYSPSYNQFAFDRDNHILYIEYPKQFPFSSIGADTQPKLTSNNDDVLFWKKFVHTALEK